MFRRAVSYRFPQWAAETIGDPATARAVQEWFEERGLPMVEEQWRKLLRGIVAEIPIETWCRICDISGKPLSYFWEYQPSEVRPEPRPRRGRRSRGAARRRPPTSRPAPPPLPRMSQVAGFWEDAGR